jgi:hypothetical protein
MKIKKLKKLAKFIHEVGRVNRMKRLEIEDRCIPATPIFSQSHICDYDEEISNKVSNFILNLIKLQSKLNLDFNENCINIHCDLTQFMKSTSNRSIKEEHIEISISSEGFRLRRNYDNYISFRDENFLEILKPHLVERYKKISKENIKEIIDDVMIITNLSRENNLDELLKLED